MRQLESSERKNRACAAAGLEFENKLRSECESYMTENELLMNENKELARKLKKVERERSECEDELHVSNESIKSLEVSFQSMHDKWEHAQTELHRALKINTSLLQSTKESDTKAQSLMMKNLRESEKRHQFIVRSLELELQMGREKRAILQKNSETLVTSTGLSPFLLAGLSGDSRHTPKRQTFGTKPEQADILQSTLQALEDVEKEDDASHANNDRVIYDFVTGSKNSVGSFAYTEQLCQCFKVAKIELDELRKQLQESEDNRKTLEIDLESMKDVCTSYPLLESMVSKMANKISAKDNEILSLHEDMSDMRLLYHSHLDCLIEEQTKHTPVDSCESSTLISIAESQLQIEQISSGFGVL